MKIHKKITQIIKVILQIDLTELGSISKMNQMNNEWDSFNCILHRPISAVTIYTQGLFTPRTTFNLRKEKKKETQRKHDNTTDWIYISELYHQQK